MAVYFQNTLVSISNYLKETNLYSSPQSVSRARKKGTLKATGVTVGEIFFVEMAPEISARLLLLPGWEGLPTVSTAQIPAGLTLLSRISKRIGMGEATILTWAVINKLDVYWVGGFAFANMAKAEELAALTRQQQAIVKPKVKRKTRYRLL